MVLMGLPRIKLLILSSFIAPKLGFVLIISFASDLFVVQFVITKFF